MRLHGAHVVVTGASSGIGASMAREFAVRGAHVTLVARNREALERVADEITTAGGSCAVEPADLGSLSEIEALVARLNAGPGTPDVIVNNAGAGRWRAIDETEPGEAQQMMALPYLAAFELSRLVAPAMISRGHGQIVCMTSLAGYTHIPGANGYTVARWAMRAFAHQLRVDLRGTGVNVTLIAPSEVASPYFDNNPGSHERVPRIVRLLGGASTTDAVARAAVNAVERGRKELIYPWQAAWMRRLVPPRAVNRLVASTGWER